MTLVLKILIFRIHHFAKANYFTTVIIFIGCVKNVAIHLLCYSRMSSNINWKKLNCYPMLVFEYPFQKHRVTAHFPHFPRYMYKSLNIGVIKSSFRYKPMSDCTKLDGFIERNISCIPSFAIYLTVTRWCWDKIFLVLFLGRLIKVLTTFYYCKNVV